MKTVPKLVGRPDVEIVLNYTKETKNTFVFTSDGTGDDGDAAVPTLYIKKSAFPNGAPPGIKVMISATY